MEKGQSFARRDRILQIEEEIQRIWEQNQPNNAEIDENKKKYFATFPYPYMNGKLHLGHAFSMSKSEIQIRYRKLEGYNVLFPQGFHCTGMPIQAAANKLRKELEEGWNGKGLSQSSILKQMGIEEELIKNFKDSEYWLHYFPPIGMKDLKRLGVAVDWRRSFITTQQNPYYDSFIRWQFNQLKANNAIAFGKRPTIISPSDNQICTDHDRSEGEGVNPQEYTLIKIQVIIEQGNIDRIQNPKFKQLLSESCKIFLVAATLRPETMYGQTNCYILPTGEYGMFVMKNNEYFICSERAAHNLSFQNLTLNDKKVEKVCDLIGEELIGLALKAPLSKYEKVFSLPMMTISMGKGTGIVTSVPSDSPDDYAALRDLQTKKPLREKYHLTDEMVIPFSPIEIINIPDYSSLSAVKACEEFKVKSQNDKVQLQQAKDKVYNKGFYEGILLVGNFAGKKVQEVKVNVRDEMIKQNEACMYYEPDGVVISRGGENCVVGFVDQWFLNYADEEWKEKVRQHVKDSSKFSCFNENVQKAVGETVEWLKEWGCSRSMGLGTKLPWDNQFLIESLSDSTLYFAYYTIAHHLQSDLEGQVPGTLNILPQQLTDNEWNAILLEDDSQIDNLLISKEQILLMRKEFLYWYPMDLRCSGKDLIKNHLTMSLFNHAAIFHKKHMPKAYFCNGYVNVDDQKMSKSTGNFLTIEDVIKLYGADPTRMAIATAGDTLDDANFERNNADQAILKLSTLEQFYRDCEKTIDGMRSIKESDQFYDQVFLNQLRVAVKETREAYSKMRFRDIMKVAFFELVNQKEEYKINVKNNVAREVMIEYLLYQVLLIQPITPHISEYLYSNIVLPILKKYSSISLSNAPPQHLYHLGFHSLSSDPISYSHLQQYEIIKAFIRNVRTTLEKLKNFKKNKKDQQSQQPQSFNTILLFYALEYTDWQKEVLILLQQSVNQEFEVTQDWKEVLKQRKLQSDIQKKSLMFGTFTLQELKEKGKSALDLSLSFQEVDLYKMIEETILKESQCNSIKYINLKEEIAQRKEYQVAVSNTYPGKAQVLFE